MVGKNSQELVSIKIEAELESLEQIKKIFSAVEKDNTVQFCDGNAKLKLLSTGDNLAFSGGAEVELLLTFSVGVASGVIGNLVYNAICCGIKKLALNGRRTRITEENITQAIQTIKELVLLSKKNDSSNQDLNVQDGHSDRDGLDARE